MSALDEITRQRVIPVLRCAHVDDAVETARAAAAGGLRVVELTMSIPRILAGLATLVEDGLLVGLGTIRSAHEVAPAAAAGASFVVSFYHPPGFVEAANIAGVSAVPGAFTPTELAAAHQSGAPAVKLFPARLATPDYVRDLRPLLPNLRVVVSGGIEASAEAIVPWLEAGATAVAVGGALGTAATVGAAEIERRCRKLSNASRKLESAS